MKKNKVLNATIWYTISGFLMKGMGVFTTPIFSRILTQEEYGSAENFYACLSIITIIGSLCISASLVRGRFDYKDELKSFVKSNLLFATLFTIIGCGVLLINSSIITNYLMLDYKYFILILFSVIVSPAYDMFVQIEQFQYKYKIVTFISTMNTITGVVLSLVLMAILEDNLWARIIGGQIPILCSGMIIYLYYLIKGGRIRLEYIKYALQLCIPYMIHLLSGTILNSSDRIMVTKICGASSNALYSMAYNVAQVANVLWISMNSAFSPWQCEQLSKGNYNEIKRYSYYYILIFMSCAVGLMLIAPELLLILGGQKYFDSKGLIPVIVQGYFFLFLYSLYVNIEQYEGKNIGMAIASMISAVLNVFLNIIFIPIFGYSAAAYTTLVSYFFLFVFHLIMVLRMKKKDCFNLKFIWGIVIVTCVCSLCIIKLYNSIIARYFILLLYILFLIIILFKYREKIAAHIF